MPTNCNAWEVKDEQGNHNLMIEVPWDAVDLINLVQNMESGKKSVTLCNGSIVQDRESRNPLPLYVEFGGYRVKLNGTVNLWCNKPDGKGSTAQFRKTEQELQAELAIARAERESSQFTLHLPLCDKYGNVVAKVGETMLRETLGNKLLAGYFLMPQQQYDELYPQEITTSVVES